MKPTRDITFQLAQLLAGIAAFRRRSWTLALSKSATTMLWAWFLTLVAFAAILHIVSHPALRLVLLILHIVIIIAAFIWGTKHLLWHRHNLRSWALRCEEVFPELKERLITCVEMASGTEGDRIFRDNNVANALLLETCKNFEKFDPVLAIPTRRFVRHAILALIPIVIGGWLAWWNPTTINTAFRYLYSSASPQTIASPSQVPRLVVEPGDTEVPRGSRVIVTALIEPSNAIAQSSNPVLSASLGDLKSKSTVMNSSPDQAGKYFMELPSIQSTTHYKVTNDQLQSPIYTIIPYDPPRIDSITTLVTPPAYTRRAAHSEKGNFISALKGSTLKITVMSSDTLASAFLVGDGDDILEGTVKDKQAVFDLTLENNVSYTVRIADLGEHENLNPPVLELVANDDNAPRVDVRQPGADWTIHRVGEIDFDLIVRDDVGVETVELEYHVNNSDAQTLSFYRAPETGTLKSEQTIHHVLELEDWGLEPGDFILYRIVAQDGQPDREIGRAISQSYFLQIRPFDSVTKKGNQVPGDLTIPPGEAELIIATQRLIDSRSKLDEEKVKELGQDLSRTQSNIRQNTQRKCLECLDLGPIEEMKARQAVLDQAIEEMRQAEDTLWDSDFEKALKHETAALSLMTKATSGLPEFADWVNDVKITPFVPVTAMSLTEQQLDLDENRYEMDISVSSEKDTDRRFLETLLKVQELARRQKEFQEKLRNQPKFDYFPLGNFPTAGENLEPDMPFIPLVEYNVAIENFRDDLEESKRELERLRDEFDQMQNLDPEALARLQEIVNDAMKELASADEALRQQEIEKAESANARVMDRFLELELQLKKEQKRNDRKQLRKLARKVGQLATRQQNLNDATQRQMQSKSSDDRHDWEPMVQTQGGLARETKEIKTSVPNTSDKPPTSNDAPASELLQQAADSMANAGRLLEKNQPKAAMEEQELALDALNQAKNQLDQQVARENNDPAERLAEALEAIQDLQVEIQEAKASIEPPSKPSEMKDNSPESSDSESSESAPGKPKSMEQNQQGESQSPSSTQHGSEDGAPSQNSQRTADSQTASETPQAKGQLVKQMKATLSNVRELLDRDETTKPISQRAALMLQQLKQREDYTTSGSIEFTDEFVESLDSLQELILLQLEVTKNTEELRELPEDELPAKYRSMAAKYFELLSHNAEGSSTP